MSTSYKATEIDTPYYLTITKVGWVDVFTRKIYLYQSICGSKWGDFAQRLYSKPFTFPVKPFTFPVNPFTFPVKPPAYIVKATAFPVLIIG
ncbi:hypothetical protein [Frigoriflavimonas asaccharolytica]|uniref:Uncharacterized protein n=1 Tax=Frigoriflavimonas asaccharolytica TaxID=2735899 RepID=A0A8J8K7Y4_9FLAO|nr:hypothetical protein [Frigoriflavimonas asaccharolytica]NRS91427.1 hypothetical protein [Frigoriflavimonas asaccharolytica]